MYLKCICIVFLTLSPSPMTHANLLPGPFSHENSRVTVIITDRILLLVLTDILYIISIAASMFGSYLFNADNIIHFDEIGHCDKRYTSETLIVAQYYYWSNAETGRSTSRIMPPQLSSVLYSNVLLFFPSLSKRPVLLL